MANYNIDNISDAERFERYETVGVVGLDGGCPCWRPSLTANGFNDGPFIIHPAGCLCPCHSAPPNYGG